MNPTRRKALSLFAGTAGTAGFVGVGAAVAGHGGMVRDVVLRTISTDAPRFLGRFGGFGLNDHELNGKLGGKHPPGDRAFVDVWPAEYRS